MMGNDNDDLPEPCPKTRGISREFDRLKSDGGASVAELRDFLGQMHGRSPQDVIGMIAGSGLTRSMLLAALLCGLVLLVFTVFPYALESRSNGVPTAADKAVKVEASSQDPGADTVSDSSPTTAGSPLATATGGSNGDAGLDADRAVDAMGIGETRIADPDENPLESRLDDLLDGIE